MKYKLTKLEYLKPFLLGGECNFILQNTISNNHLNYIIRKKEYKDKTFTYYVYFKSTNEVYIGYINQAKTHFYRNTKELVQDEFRKQINVFESFFDFIFNRNKIPLNIEILYTGQCGRCGDTLTNPKYIKIGLGKYCADLLGIKT